MADKVALEVALRLAGTLTKTLDLDDAVDRIDKDYSQVIRDGIGIDQANFVWHDQRTLANGAEEDLDLAALVSPLGTAILATRMKAILIVASKDNTDRIDITQHPASGVPFMTAGGDGIRVRPAGRFLLTAPDATSFAVTASTNRVRVMNPGAGAATYDAFLIGTVSP